MLPYISHWMSNPDYNRRRVLKRIATSGAVIAGVGGITGSASAQSISNSTPEDDEAHIERRRQEFLNNPSKVEKRIKEKSNHPTPDYQDVDDWEALDNVDPSCVIGTNRGAQIHAEDCSTGVCRNAWGYAGYVLDEYLDDCRWQTDVAAEIEAHCADQDWIMGMTCCGWKC